MWDDDYYDRPNPGHIIGGVIGFCVALVVFLVACNIWVDKHPNNYEALYCEKGVCKTAGASTETKNCPKYKKIRTGWFTSINGELKPYSCTVNGSNTTLE